MKPFVASAVLSGWAVLLASCQPEQAVCPFGLSAQVVRACGQVTMPRSNASPDGATATFAYAVLPGHSNIRSSIATVVVPGGPGGRVGRLARQFAGLLKEHGLTPSHDLIFYDQRGLGESSTTGAAPCHLRPITAELAPDVFENQLRDCMKGMTGQLDSRFLNTSTNADDIVALAKALGYQGANLYGMSYGTRTAQEVVKRHPGFVRRLVLDGVVDPAVSPFVRQAGHLQQTLGRFGADCHAAGKCVESDLPRQIQRLADHLDSLKLTFSGEELGVHRQLPLGSSVLLAALWDTGYSPQDMQTLPELLAAASTGQRKVLDALVQQAVNEGGDAVDPLVYTAVACQDTHLGNEMPQPLLPVFERRAQATKSMWAMCRSLGFTAPNDVQVPVTAQIPTLLLSGRYDSVTPPETAATVAARFTPSQHVIFEAGGHINGKSPCGLQMILTFLDNPGAKLAADCAAQPFFP